LHSSLTDPKILGTDPYPFLGHFSNYATILLRFAEGRFSMDYYYHFCANSDQNQYDCAMVRTNYSVPGGSIIGIDTLEIERHFRPEKAKLLTFDKFFNIGEYKPLTKEQLAEVMAERGINCNENKIGVYQVWPPFQKVEPHSEGDFPDLVAFIDGMRRMEYLDDGGFDDIEDDL
jgi:hypothetical protein